MDSVTTIDPRMGAFDAVMYGVEEDPLLRSVITLVAQLDQAPDAQIVEQRIDRMTRATPKLRQRAVGNPLSLLPPRWEIDPNFDMSYHLRWTRIAVPDAGLGEVLELAQVISEQDFDGARPLWEMHIVTDLEDDQAAFIFKIHHAITDGVGGMQMAAAILDIAREPDYDLGPMPEIPQGGVLGLGSRLKQGVRIESRDVASDVKSTVGLATSFMKRALSDPMTTALDTQQWAASAGRLLAPASEPMSPIWKKRSLKVAFSVAECRLDDLKAAGKAVDGTLNDAFMATVAGGLLKYHQLHGESPEELRVNMPINVRQPADSAAGGNKWVPARLGIPTNVKDAGGRMRQLHPILQQARFEPALAMSDVVYKLMSVLPRPITTSIAGGLMKGTDFAATNVPGPPIPVYFAGAKLLSMIPFAPKAGASANIGLMTYDGTVFLGINIDRAAVENPEELTDCIIESLEEVLAVGRRN